MAVSLVFMIVMNILAVMLPLNGISTAKISDQFPVYFVPSGYVFSIWGVIYITQIFALFKLFKNSKQYNELINKVFLIYFISNVANGMWLVTWHYGSFYIGVFIMILLLLTLIYIYLQIKKLFPTNKSLTVAFGIYLGWISVATIANITDVLYLLRFTGFGIPEQIWSAVLILIASILGFLMIKLNKEYAYACVIIWATIGIAVKFYYEITIVLAVAMACLMLITAGLVKLIKDKSLGK